MYLAGSQLVAKYLVRRRRLQRMSTSRCLQACIDYLMFLVAFGIVFTNLLGWLISLAVLCYNAHAIHILGKKTEREKLEKLAQKGPKPEETPAANAGGSGTGAEAKASESTSAKTGVSTDDHRNYAVVAGVVTGLSALGWYLLSKDKKTEELHD
ncbi:hypothetical protein Ccrd_007319 [Cynara cardunculus var. scolymus]|uniref:Uncharacterized protein n=1 Tax=Cynara cardunculus var. scolymus TaxID=59895 RepID=A0A103XHC9_CYNCS|nr:hypothetical protein Ccrd_007319 [Cynara cardunculus var. scolymus]